MENRKKDLSVLRHSAAHLLAHAVTELFPDTLLTIGPATEDGFFYDFQPTRNFKEEDLILIENRMHEIANQNLPLIHKEISKKEARELYKNNPFKLELIENIPGDTVGLSVQGSFYDLCRGGHVASTGNIKHFKLLTISGSYWRAERDNAVLQRISGTAFDTEADLQLYLQRREDAIAYDHRKIGKQLDLFSFHDEGPGFPFFHPKGQRIIIALQNYIRKLLDDTGYQEISTPLILNDSLWKQSGHYAHYKENMYFCTIDEKEYAIRPMNCPGAILVYKERPHSYRELPLRLSEFGIDHRYELSGVLHGLLRVRSFTMDDAHIFCTQDQIEQEVTDIILMAQKVHKRLGFDKVYFGLSTRPEKSMGADNWIKATNALKNVLEKLNIDYAINEGDGAFYGPKIDFSIEDSLARRWQLSTIQIDFCQPDNFDLTYIASGGQKERPVMIHRAIYGSFPRILGILLEHHKGRLPFWLAPTQVKILTITDTQIQYAQQIAKTLRENDIRAEVDNTSDQISAQIKVAQLEKIPLMIVIGKLEEKNQTVTLRYIDGEQKSGL
ncbi:MAG TPA: threonine--tRNA ligase, partial [Candidatus Babeliales bacterium]|nr:threonine--tRNA ligase [Candidatus Babeliales bacterium]